MANLNYRSQFHSSFAGQFVKLLVQVSIGASGAPTIVSSTGMGITSITRNSAGKYTLLLSNPFASLLGVHCVINSGSSAPAAPLMNMVADTVTSSSAPSVAIQFRSIAAAAADPASGEVLTLQLDLNRSSLPN